MFTSTIRTTRNPLKYAPNLFIYLLRILPFLTLLNLDSHRNTSSRIRISIHTFHEQHFYSPFLLLYSSSNFYTRFLDGMTTTNITSIANNMTTSLFNDTPSISSFANEIQSPALISPPLYASLCVLLIIYAFSIVFGTLHSHALLHRLYHGYRPRHSHMVGSNELGRGIALSYRWVSVRFIMIHLYPYLYLHLYSSPT
jgi:hypothetical protein